LAEAGAAILLQQKDLTVNSLADILKNLNRETCLNMAQKARALGKPDATKNVAQVCKELAK